MPVIAEQDGILMIAATNNIYICICIYHIQEIERNPSAKVENAL